MCNSKKKYNLNFFEVFGLSYLQCQIASKNGNYTQSVTLYKLPSLGLKIYQCEELNDLLNINHKF